MEPEPLDRIRFVTRHFGELQGLWVLVPMGLIFLGGGLVTFFDSFALFLLDVPVFAAALFLLSRAKPYYRTRFGEVEHQGASPPARFYLEALVPALGVGFVFFLAVTGSQPFRRMQYVLFGSFLFFRWLGMEHRLSQGYNLVLGLLLLALAVPDGPAGVAPVHEGMSQILCGLSWILAGLLDHRQLVRTLGRLAASPLEHEDASPAEEER